MKHPSGYFGIAGIGACALVVIVMATSASATSHSVKFGGTAGYKYVPATLSVSVGDTVIWEGDFTLHPLSSTTLPAGSATWHVSSGTRFSYVIPAQGKYNYRCDLHSGMTGSFQTETTGANSLPHATLTNVNLTVQLMISARETPVLRITTPHAGRLSIQVTDLGGRIVTSGVIAAVNRGTAVFPFAKTLSDGTCIVRIKLDRQEAVRLFTIIY